MWCCGRDGTWLLDPEKADGDFTFLSLSFEYMVCPVLAAGCTVMRRQCPASVVGEEAFGLPTFICVCFPPVVFYWLSCRQESWNELAISLSSNLLPMGTWWNMDTHALLSVFREKHLPWELWAHLPWVARLPMSCFLYFNVLFYFLNAEGKVIHWCKEIPHPIIMCAMFVFGEISLHSWE